MRVCIHMVVGFHTCVPPWVYVSPSLVQCISIIRHMPACVRVTWAVCCYCDCHVRGGEEEGDISCLDATNFLFMHGAHRRYAHARAHPHTIDRFIIACQERAGVTFQQNGAIWHANGCPPPLQLFPTPLPSTPAHPAGPLRQIQNATKYMFLSQASCQLFLHEQEKWGKNRSFWQ